MVLNIGFLLLIQNNLYVCVWDFRSFRKKFCNRKEKVIANTVFELKNSPNLNMLGTAKWVLSVNWDFLTKDASILQ